MQSNEGLPPKSVADLDITKWILRYQRNRNIVPAGLPRFFLGHIVAMQDKINELEFRCEQRGEALATEIAKNKKASGLERPTLPTPEAKKSNGNKKLKKDES